VSRNFDFTTQTLSELQGRSPASDEPILAGQPYIIETYPDEGHATLIVCLFDLASGAVDGINDAGLVAALLADDESTNVEPTHGPQAGLGEHEICRYLLETCETVDDALEELRVAKQYYEFVPCHYLVADRVGRAFVWDTAPPTTARTSSGPTVPKWSPTISFTATPLLVTSRPSPATARLTTGHGASPLRSTSRGHLTPSSSRTSTHACGSTNPVNRSVLSGTPSTIRPPWR
jgi:hypothetical protein